MGLGVIVGLVFLGLLIWAIAGTLAKRRGQMDHHDRCAHCQAKLRFHRNRYELRCRACLKAQPWAPGAPVTLATNVAPVAPNDVTDQLRKLASLRDEGVLTEEEFAAQKAKLLGP